MVYIRKIEMRGFKSFGPRKVSVSLERGLTVITGPNGSGKSNIMDAVRFVLGELSARTLRADKFSGIIFDGNVAQGEGPKSALVAIQFDNTDRRIPSDIDIVSVSREVDKTGQSTYRLNGRKISRGQLVDILTVADLHASGYNMIMQGTITRLADVTPEERRKILDELIGIAEYDSKKAEAQIQLNEADINLKVATAHIEEVQKRIEDLERERNDALRYNFIEEEIKRLKAQRISYEISEIKKKLEEVSKRLQKEKTAVDSLDDERKKLQTKREQVESEWRKFDENVVDKGNTRLFSVQKSIGDINADIARLKTEMSAGKISLTGLAKMHDERSQNIESIRKSLKDSRKTLVNLRGKRDRLQEVMNKKQDRFTEVSDRLSEMKNNLGKNTDRIEKIGEELEVLNRQIIKLNTKIEGASAKLKVADENLQTLEARKTSFESTFQNLKTHIQDLYRIQKEEKIALRNIMELIERNKKRKEIFEQELSEADRTAQRAKKAIVEVETQKDFAEKVAAEEKALLEIETMGKGGVIPGVYGRLNHLIRVKPDHREAIEATSVGWLQSIVVADVSTALRCVESLKRTKLGRIKLIPLREVSSTRTVRPPKIDGVIDTAASIIRCDPEVKPAVNFVFGDTVITEGDKSAFEAMKKGYRACTLEGDLYEPGGGMESGYYRSPIDLATIIPSESAMESLGESVNALDTMLTRRRTDIRTADDEIAKLNDDKVRRSNVIGLLDHEIEEVRGNISRIRRNISVLNRRIKSLHRIAEKEKSESAALNAQRDEIRKKAVDLQKEEKSLRLRVKPAVISKYEEEKSILNSEITDLQRELVKITSNISFNESSLESTFRPGFKSAKIELSTINKQIRTLQKKVSVATASLEEAEKQIRELNKMKEQLSTSITTAKDERKKFLDSLEEIDAGLKKIDQRYTPASSEYHQIELAIQTLNIDLKHSEETLYSLGYDKPFTVILDELKGIETSLNLMNLELEKLGSVNQLAVDQYSEYKDNYKQLSVRRNQLEEERRAIVKFMQEIEEKKRSAFTKAYEQSNESFKALFSKLTGGGVGWMQLQNPDDIFSGGIDIFVQFPGKAARLVSGTSGGEKSVAAVGFLLSIQSISPASFYMFDEIDAHLDQANAERLADLLRGQSAKSQF
ncbi:MAG TPA: chromosome segregation protein SMC, partial [archaeon]|nr:chromosome segregation protein SMC [archaeon]